MDMASNRPHTRGALRAMDSELPDLIMRSDITPPSTPPRKPATAGNAAIKPAFNIVMWRSLTRYTGNQVRKKYVSVLMQYWPM